MSSPFNFIPTFGSTFNSPNPISCFNTSCLEKKHSLPFHKKVTNYEHPQPDPVRDQFIARLAANPLEHTTKVTF